MEQSQMITALEDFGRTLTPPSQIAALLDVNEDSLKLALNRTGSAERHAYLKGLALTANKLRQNNIDLANAGSPDAIRSCFRSMQRMMEELGE